MKASELLAHFLADSDVRLDPVRSLLSARSPSTLNVTTGDGKSFLETYTIRAAIVEGKGKYLEESYGDLVGNLQAKHPTEVTVLHVGTDEKVYLVFADSGNNQLLGVIPGHTGKQAGNRE